MISSGQEVRLTPEEYNHLLQGQEKSNTQTNITLNGKYRVVFEKAASANKIDGFKVEANGDVLEEAFADAQKLYFNALVEVEKNKPVIPVPPTKQQGVQ